MQAARRAFALVPIEEINAVMHVPMFVPRMTNIDIYMLMSRWLASVMTIAVTADDDCIMPVKISPKRNRTNACHVRKSTPLPMLTNMLRMAFATSPSPSVRLVTVKDMV